MLRPFGIKTARLMGRAAHQEFARRNAPPWRAFRTFGGIAVRLAWPPRQDSDGRVRAAMRYFMVGIKAGTEPHAKPFRAKGKDRFMIRKLSSGKYRLYSRKKDPKTGKRRNLGTFERQAPKSTNARCSISSATSRHRQCRGFEVRNIIDIRFESELRNQNDTGQCSVLRSQNSPKARYRDRANFGTELAALPPLPYQGGMNILVACDSFKDALPADAVCAAIARGLKQNHPERDGDGNAAVRWRRRPAGCAGPGPGPPMDRQTGLRSFGPADHRTLWLVGRWQYCGGGNGAGVRPAALDPG